MKLSKKQKKNLITRICQNQLKMIGSNPEAYNTSRYQRLEALKVKIKGE